MFKYSIVLPVRNGGAYVKDCVASVLSQSLNDFELHVLDNCSTDGTLEWIKSLKDDRIVVHPAERPLSIEQNWGRIKDIPKNEFITLIGHDDILENHYLATMDALISKHPNATLYQTHFRYIDARGSTIRRCKPMDEVQGAGEFLAFFLASSIDTMGTGFMMRATDYDRVGGIPTYYPNLLFADFELFINVTLNGYKATAADECFAFRLHQSTTLTSSNVVFLKAYELFINYIEQLKNTNQSLSMPINRYAIDFIAFYCKGLAHRLLRTPPGKREGQTVAKFLAQSKSYADRLVPGNTFNPQDQFPVRLAKTIDANPLMRQLFLGFKKIFPKPLYN